MNSVDILVARFDMSTLRLVSVVRCSSKRAVWGSFGPGFALGFEKG